MNVYDKAELERIKKVNESNDRMEEFLSNQREELEKNIEPLFKVLSIKFNDRDSLGSVMDTQAVSLVHRQSISEKITFFLNRRSKESIKLKKLKQDKFIFYATGFGIKKFLFPLRKSKAVGLVVTKVPSIRSILSKIRCLFLS